MPPSFWQDYPFPAPKELEGKCNDAQPIAIPAHLRGCTIRFVSLNLGFLYILVLANAGPGRFASLQGDRDEAGTARLANGRPVPPPGSATSSRELGSGAMGYALDRGDDEESQDLDGGSFASHRLVGGVASRLFLFDPPLRKASV